jgi:hypothetical protein
MCKHLISSFHPCVSCPQFDLSPLENSPHVELVLAEVEDGRIPSSSVADLDALILLGE